MLKALNTHPNHVPRTAFYKRLKRFITVCHVARCIPVLSWGAAEIRILFTDEYSTSLYCLPLNSCLDKYTPARGIVFVENEINNALKCEAGMRVRLRVSRSILTDSVEPAAN